MSKKRQMRKSEKNQENPGILSAPRIELLAAVPLVLLFLTPVVHMAVSAVSEPQVVAVSGQSVVQAYSFVSWMYPLVVMITAAVMALSVAERRTEAQEALRGQKLCLEPMLWLGLFAMLMILSTCVNGWTQEALHGYGNRRESLFTYLIYIFVYFYCGSRIREKRLKRWLLYMFLGTALFVAVCTLGRGLMGGFPGLAYFEVYAGAFYNLNHYAYYLVLVLLVSAVLVVLEKSIWGRSLAAVCLCVNLLVLLRNGTVGGLVAMAAGLVVFGLLLAWQGLIPRRWFWLAAVGCAALLGVVLATKPFLLYSVQTLLTDAGTILGGEGGEALAHTGHNRMGQWLYSLELIREKPMLGWGVEGVADLMDKHTTADRVHNEYLYYAVSFGIPALLCYLMGVALCFLRGLKRQGQMTERPANREGGKGKQATRAGDDSQTQNELDPYSLAPLVGAFGYVVSACFGVSMFYTTPFFFVMLGLGQSDRR